MNSLPTIISLESARAEVHQWPMPRALSRQAPPRLDLTACIPPGLALFRNFCEAVAETLQVPQDAVPPLAVALASIGTSRAIELELAPEWSETAPLWFAVLAEPGERKSALLSQLTAPLYAWQSDEREYLRRDLSAYDERRKGLEARLAGAREKQKRAKTGDDAAKSKAEAQELRTTLENLPELQAPVVLIGTATPEGVRDGLIQNGEKLAWVADEASAEDLLGTRYAKSGGSDFDLPLKCFTGNPHTVLRAGGRSMSLNRPAMVLALCVQPAALAGVLRDPAALGKGFVARLCPVRPESRMGHRSLNPVAMDENLKEWWGKTIRGMLALPWPGRVILTTDGPTQCVQPPRVLRLTSEAKTVFDKLRLDVEHRQQEGQDLRPISAFASKLPGVIARIALVFEAMQNPAGEFITGVTMEAACAWAPFLIEHFRAVLGDAAESDALKLARRLLAAVKRNDLPELSAHEAHRILDGNGLTREEVDPALDLLLDADWLRKLPQAESRTGRPPSTRYAVNPAAFEK